MRSRSRLSKENVRAYLDRPWEELERLQRRYWDAALRVDPLATLRASEALWELLDEQGHTRNAEERRVDLEAHVRYRALLDRAAHAAKQAR